MVTHISRDKSDLFSYSIFKFLFKNKKFLLTLRIVTLIIFVTALIYGFLEPLPKEHHFSIAIFWSLFWPFFMVVSLASFGSIFCSICPHSFLGRYISIYGFGLKVPKLLQNPLIGLGLLIGSYWMFLYLFPGVLKTPFVASLFFLIFTIFAFLGYFLFKDMGYCKYFCPIASITTGFSKSSFTWLGTYEESCKECNGYECAKACPYHLSPFNFNKKSSMEECKLCMECAFACEAVGFFATKPSKSLTYIDKASKSSDIWTYILIAALASISMMFQNALGNSPISQSLPWKVFGKKLDDYFGVEAFSFEGVLVLVLSFFLTLFFTLGMYKIASKLYNIEFKTLFKTAGYSIAPLVIFGGTAQTIPFFFTHYGSDTINGILSLFSQSSFITPFLEKSSPILKVFALLHIFGVTLGLIILYKRMKKFLGVKRRFYTLFFMLGSFHLFYLSLILFIIYIFVAKS